jgi:hypothetical protein
LNDEVLKRGGYAVEMDLFVEVVEQWRGLERER